MTPLKFTENLKSVNLRNVFNPYTQNCEVHDLFNSSEIRINQLFYAIQKSIECEIDSIWVGRDLGYRGGRRTGLALTDDIHVQSHGLRWGLEFISPVKMPNIKELTASIIWQRLDLIKAPIFLWNIFPFHPYLPENVFSNRAHNKTERIIGLDILNDLIGLLKPKKLVALGNDAASCLNKFSNYQTFNVRHPSYGGQIDFRKNIDLIYNIQTTNLFTI
ncbi:MAG: uracil-DNA glycosylase [Candidatus Symbiobacter sp.]|nr:uracil-DNA glycosylase [Candidatus Symbiobacter sp.]